LKQFSIIVIVLSAFLSIITHLLHQIHLYIGHLEMFYPAIEIYMRFGELTLLLGFTGVFLTIKQPRIKMLSLCIIIIGSIHFFLIEFGIILSLSHSSNILLISQLVLVAMLVLQFRSYDLGLFMVKGYYLIVIVVLYGIAYMVLNIIDKPVVDSFHTTLTGTILTIFFIMFKIGLFSFFKEWYREAFTYNNKDLANL